MARFSCTVRAGKKVKNTFSIYLDLSEFQLTCGFGTFSMLSQNVLEKSHSKTYSLNWILLVCFHSSCDVKNRLASWNARCWPSNHFSNISVCMLLLLYWYCHSHIKITNIKALLHRINVFHLAWVISLRLCGKVIWVISRNTTPERKKWPVETPKRKKEFAWGFFEWTFAPATFILQFMPFKKCEILTSRNNISYKIVCIEYAFLLCKYLLCENHKINFTI